MSDLSTYGTLRKRSCSRVLAHDQMSTGQVRGREEVHSACLLQWVRETARRGQSVQQACKFRLKFSPMTSSKVSFEICKSRSKLPSQNRVATRIHSIFIIYKCAILFFDVTIKHDL